ncbi:MAG: hypothetical protein LBK73_11695 [Treponema sp.]|jgi:hypothetical protein|nr:hypothetical protein [Treponema sp.]
MRGENSNRESIVETLRRKRGAMQNHLGERGRRVWTARKAEALGHGSDAVKAKCVEASSEIVKATLKRLGYKMQGDRKVKSNGTDRDAQFQRIKRLTKKAVKSENPALSVDAKPLTDCQTIVDLIRNTRTRTGLSVRCQLNTDKYDLGVRITDEQILRIKLR